MLKVKSLKYLDRFVGRLAVRFCLLTSMRRKSNSSNSYLLIRPGGIGDAALLIPIIKTIKETHPQALVDVLAEQRNFQTFFLSAYVNRILLYTKLKDLLTISRKNYDVVIDTEQWHRLSAVVARFVKAKVLIGFSSNDRGNIFDHPISYSHYDYELDSFSRLLEPLKLTKPISFSPPYLDVPNVAIEKGRELLGHFSGKPFVALFPGASILERRWGGDKFRRVAEMLFSRDIPVVVVGGKEEAVDGEKIISGIQGLNLAGQTSLAETAAVIADSSLLVSGDSGILHVGVGLGKPTVSLFGPGIVPKWAPRGEKHIVINKNLPCSPCTKFGYTPKCPINALCMSEISVDEVTAAVIALFEKHGKS